MEQSAERGRRCAFLSAAGPHDLEVDDDLARGPLEALGWTLDIVPWNRAADWDRYDVVVVRSTWDYYRDLRAFEATLARIHDSAALLANPLPALRWNLRKTYLLDLEAQGIPILPTHAVDALEPGGLAGLRRELAADELVVKPVVGANGVDVYRVGGDPSVARAVETAFRDRPALVQPFLPTVFTEGEVSLVYLAGELSHGLRKRPRGGEFRTQEERGATIVPFDPDPSLRKLCDTALATVGGPTLYARLDLLADPDGSWRLMEMELVEPSLYLRVDPGAPDRFARALDRWARSSEAAG